MYINIILYIKKNMVRICEDKYEVDSKYNKYIEEYEFELSDFQKYAIESIIEGIVWK